MLSLDGEMYPTDGSSSEKCDYLSRVVFSLTNRLVQECDANSKLKKRMKEVEKKLAVMHDLYEREDDFFYLSGVSSIELFLFTFYYVLYIC